MQPGFVALVAGGTFLLIALIILGAYWAFVVRPESGEQESIRKRLKPETVAVANRLKLLKATPGESLSSIPALNALLGRAGGLSGKLQDFLAQAGLEISAGVFLLMTFCTAAAGFAVVHFVTRSLWLSLGAAGLGSLVPYMVVKWMRTKRLRQFEEQFPEAVDLIARTLRAGHAFTTGVKLAAEELPEPVATEFQLLYDRQNFGLPLQDALRGFAARIPILDARFFVTAVLTQREAGGNLAEVLDNLGSVIRERFRVKRQVRVISAHGRMTGWILAGLPPALAFAFMMRTPAHFRVLLEDPIGTQLIVAAILLQIVGTLIIRKLVDIEYLIMQGLSLGVWLAIGCVFLAMAIAAGAGVSLVLQASTPERRRLRSLGREKASPLLAKESLTDVMDRPAQRLARAVPKSPKEMLRLRRRLLSAGYKSYTAAFIYVVSEIGFPLVAGSVMLLWYGRTTWLEWFLAAFVAFIAYAIPGFVLGYLVGLRQKQITNGLPDALDLIIVCVEAGSGLDQAIVKAADELQISYPALAEELAQVTTETRAGRPRAEAFRNLAARTKVDDMRTLAAMLVQTERFGTSIAQALRQHADTCRTKRRQRAEEKAAKLGVKLAFPLVFCLFPAFYVVTLGPAAIRIFRVLLDPASR